MKKLTKIFVELLDENIDVWRPINAIRLYDDVFKIINQEYDKEVESWRFEPGDIVLCKLIESSNGQILAAIKKLDDNMQ